MRLSATSQMEQLVATHADESEVRTKRCKLALRMALGDTNRAMNRHPKIRRSCGVA